MNIILKKKNKNKIALNDKSEYFSKIFNFMRLRSILVFVLEPEYNDYYLNNITSHLTVIVCTLAIFGVYLLDSIKIITIKIKYKVRMKTD